ncbi:hypothetical protein BROUX41_002023 [Berkeleyomyces rouxiae]|uniref:uncharacterized protein n=1 Tax=Berkeleyomyces rouxiae TaxID=2035830 RepID=UPI003B7F7CA0
MPSTTESKAMAAEKPTDPVETPAKATVVGEDDEFEDFPADDWEQAESEAVGGSTATQHLWEESWDDDDTSDDFSAQLKEELRKVEAAKKR